MPPEEPVFFIDRSLGRKRVPERLRRAGWAVVTMAEHYGVPSDEAVNDQEWLSLAGERGWAVLMKDDRIRYRESERRALMGAGIHAFCLASASLRSAEMADIYLSRATAIFEVAGEAGPTLHILTRAGMRRITLD